MSERSAPAGKTRASDHPSMTERLQATLANVTTERDKPGNKSGKGKDTRTPSPDKPARIQGHNPRRARLRLTRVDPWSVMKTSFLLSVAFGIVSFVAVFMVWSVLGAAGVWDSINTAVASIVDSESSSGGFDVTEYVGMSRVLGFTLVVSILDVVLLTAIATLGAFLYNLAAALLGGIEVTLTEDQD